MKLLSTIVASSILLSSVVCASDSDRIKELEDRLNAMEEKSAPLGKFIDSIPVKGFMDVMVGYNDQTDQLDFKTGAIDFYLTKNIGTNVKTLIELIFETDGDDLVTDLERVQIGYEFNDGTTLWAGRFHTPYGYWNTGYHHGAQIQTSVLRPKFIDFEDAGGILPAHSTGLWLVGNAGNFGYDFYVTNGSNILSSPENDGDADASFGELNMNKGGDNDKNKAFGANIYYDIDELRLGVHGLTQEVGIFNGSKSTLNMYGGYLVYDDSELEIMSELYLFNNKNNVDTIGTRSGETFSSYAAFIQVAYNFVESWTPFVRYEKTDLDENDVYFASQKTTTGDSYRRYALGVKYDINYETALKFEFYNTDEKGADDKINEAVLQLAVRF